MRQVIGIVLVGLTAMMFAAAGFAAVPVWPPAAQAAALQHAKISLRQAILIADQQNQGTVIEIMFRAGRDAAAPPGADDNVYTVTLATPQRLGWGQVDAGTGAFTTVSKAPSAGPRAPEDRLDAATLAQAAAALPRAVEHAETTTGGRAIEAGLKPGGAGKPVYAVGILTPPSLLMQHDGFQAVWFDAGGNVIKPGEA